MSSRVAVSRVCPAGLTNPAGPVSKGICLSNNYGMPMQGTCVASCHECDYIPL